MPGAGHPGTHVGSQERPSARLIRARGVPKDSFDPAKTEVGGIARYRA
jgi:hypothetical protein